MTGRRKIIIPDNVAILFSVFTHFDVDPVLSHNKMYKMVHHSVAILFVYNSESSKIHLFFLEAFCWRNL